MYWEVSNICISKNLKKTLVTANHPDIEEHTYTQEKMNTKRILLLAIISTKSGTSYPNPELTIEIEWNMAMTKKI